MTEKEAIEIAHKTAEREVPNGVLHSVTLSMSHAGLSLVIAKNYHGVDVYVRHGVPIVLKEMFERLCEVQWRDMVKAMNERWP